MFKKGAKIVSSLRPKAWELAPAVETSARTSAPASNRHERLKPIKRSYSNQCDLPV